MINATAIAFTGYPVTDMDRARGFYEGILGLKEARKWEHNGRAWVEYELEGAALAVTNMAMEIWKPSSDGPSVALEVADFDAAVAALRKAGVPFAVEPVDNGGCFLAVVTDPDGNAIAIHRNKNS
jgi:catechol 2,3-dioxygenase-like lactoylglutathione lyase family enzyme